MKNPFGLVFKKNFTSNISFLYKLVLVVSLATLALTFFYMLLATLTGSLEMFFLAFFILFILLLYISIRLTISKGVKWGYVPIFFSCILLIPIIFASILSIGAFTGFMGGIVLISAFCLAIFIFKFPVIVKELLTDTENTEPVHNDIKEDVTEGKSDSSTLPLKPRYSIGKTILVILLIIVGYILQAIFV